jgi:hypothetical protein
MDMLGNCPHCNKDWDGGDIMENLMKMDCFMNIGQTALELIAIGNYGWTRENGKKFSLAVLHTIEGKVYAECPSCLSVFELISGERYPNIHLTKVNNETSGETII